MSQSSVDLSIPALEERIQPGLDRVEKLLIESSAAGRGVVADLTTHLAQAGGKRLRPVLSMVSAQLGDPELALSDEVIVAATVVELTHLASLYHDDVMDSAPTRRGAPSAQHLWGNNRAILAGDVLFARASQLVADLGALSIKRHAGTFDRMCIGQLNESFGPEADVRPVDFYLQVLADKTGALVAEAAFMGAYHGGAGEDVARVVESFGEKIGVAFQIADDVLDLTSDSAVSGKTPGTDLLEGVDTLPILLLKRDRDLGKLDREGQVILDLIDDDLARPGALAEVVSLLCAHDVLEETRSLARAWADDAVAGLGVLPASEAKDGLVAFAQMMVDRQA